MNIGAIVLAGGSSSRMGQPKEALPFRGSTLLGHVVETLLLCTHPVVVVARDAEQELPPLPIECEVCCDDPPGGGPLVAMAAGLRMACQHCDAAFVTGCDTPYVDASTLEWLASQIGSHDAVVPHVGGRAHPLVALYRTRILEVVERRLTAGDRAPKQLLEHIDARLLDEQDVDAFDPQQRFLRNLNDAEEYRAAVEESDP